MEYNDNLKNTMIDDFLWSLQSNSTTDTKDVWTDTEKESDDLLMMSDRSDSGITSPHNHLDDHQSVSISPCSLSLIDQIPTDDVRKRIMLMTKKCYDEDDKLCLMQILSLLNNLEALSQDQSLNGDDISMELNLEKYRENSELRCFRATSFSSPTRGQGKIVATVQPYTTTTCQLEPKKEDAMSISEQKTTCWMTNSLGESGVFEDSERPLLAGEYCNQETQTESLEEFACEQANVELCEEIEKLNRFRKKMEVSKNKHELVNLLSTDTHERHLKFYQDRLHMLENKILIYESSGDLQIKLLAERLQREIQLESWNKQLQEKIDKLESEHFMLEEVNCELEEIENDTRLRLQRLEIEFEVMQQRNMELEMSKKFYQEKFHDAKKNVSYLEECLQKAEEKIFLLEELEMELRHKLELTQVFLPTVALYQEWRIKQEQKQEEKKNQLNQNSTDLHPDHPILLRMNQLMQREKELTQNIADLNRAYNETLENADNLWAQMEKEYKEKIANCEATEMQLRSKIMQLEHRLLKDTEYAQERIANLEETELNLKQKLCKLSRESKEQNQKYTQLLEEMNLLKEEHQKLQNYLNGPVTENFERDRRKIKNLEEDLTLVRKMLNDVEEGHRSEKQLLKKQLQVVNKELTHCEVTNSELREEVDTLESRIRELEMLRKCDVDKIKMLTDELEAKQNQLRRHQQFGKIRPSSKSLAQELEKPIIRQRTVIPTTDDVNAARSFLAECNSSGQKASTKEVKSLADSIICNAEACGGKFVSIKKSFVEEARSRFAKWV